MGQNWLQWKSSKEKFYQLTEFKVEPPFYEDKIENADVCIIGTGAGGAVVAYNLAQAGLHVLMLEKGGHYPKKIIEKETREEKLLELWKNRGAQLALTYGVAPLLAVTQGECVGGSTIINYGMSFKIPPETLDIWKDKTGVEFSSDELDKEYEIVKEQIHVTKITNAGKSHEMLEKGCKNKYSGDWMDKNYKPTDDENKGVKQNVLLSYLEKADPNFLHVYSNCKVTKLIKDGDKISEIKAVHTITGKTITVKSKITILSAGAIASSELLLQNNISNNNKQVGKHLGLHPASSVIAQFDQPINGQNDLSMAYACEQFGIEKRGDRGYMIESVFVSPATFSTAAPGIGEDNAKFMKKYHQSAVAGVLIQDEANGSVALNWSNDAIIHYSLSDSDGKLLIEGLKKTAEIFLRAGATQVITGHFKETILTNKDQLDLIEKRGYKLGSLKLASAHPQGGNRMGTDKKTSVVNSECRSHEIENLYICDASVFPTPLGVNPQLTVMTIASLAAKKIIEKRNSIFTSN